MSSADVSGPKRGSLINDPKIRGLIYQFVLVAVLAFLVYGAASNAIENLRAARIASGFGFLNQPAGFDVNQKLIPFSSSGSTYADAFFVGLLNTLLVAAIAVVVATVLGFVIGVARLSQNWIVAKLAAVYVECVRNVPLLLQLFIWYNAVLKPLPGPRQSLELGAGTYLNSRGLFLPQPLFGERFGWVWIGLAVAIAGSYLFHRWAHRQQLATGRQYPVIRIAIGLIIGLPLVIYFLIGQPLTFNYPELRGFNFAGGIQVFPEFVALLIGLATYTAAFIAEIVRAGILSVSRGQTEAAYALGLHSSPTLRLVVIPQAMRVIIPPLTNQYLNLVKNSSLAVAIGYPDLVQVFMGTVLNQTGQAVEVIAITMAVYLAISVVTSLLMNIYNRRMAIVER
ncbi:MULTISPECIES: amino acid ABC transporter permease [unclassified Chelatococcus]|uniref:amino acid ABC transporter permease n=1 Tax=unclassified Chelatococcus TaxID=2638111 RepID=UPI00224BB4E9|nr:amino acid ABC transporter permease [Chelatococcus sp.]MCO5077015.1 amino acid ABC transporter permease [Chelatococcus sp.]CAH1671390.1 putative ABC transporter membrane subunit YhdX [Hyphomicrobiales bacterium]CAH1676405.1 putative ABC transporter membrane subunit YhdX [Hyphomicrobiales bacterium]